VLNLAVRITRNKQVAANGETHLHLRAVLDCIDIINPAVCKKKKKFNSLQGR
jgi:hypothetical protein